MQLTSFHKEKYGDWAGNPAGHKPDPTRCAEEVRVDTRWPTYHQCTRKRGFGPEGAFCKQHDPAAKAERQRIADEKYRVSMRKWIVQASAPRMLAIIEQIAAGHNDPRTLCTDFLKTFNKE